MSAAIHLLSNRRTTPQPDFTTSSGPVADWLDTQARLVAAWRDRLVAESGDIRLIALLDQHAAFLAEAREAAGFSQA